MTQKDSPSAQAIAAHHDAWKRQIPEDDDALWAWLWDLEDESRLLLLAHCVSFGVNALNERAERFGSITPVGVRNRLAQADRLARAAGLDMVAAGWRPTAANYLGRVPKARVIEAVREAKGEQIAELLDHLKKAEMAQGAEGLLADSDWLPEPLRLPEERARQQDGAGDAAALPAFLARVDDEPLTDE
jgi:ParB family chromosome partitioning protein